MNAFMVFSQMRRRRIIAKNPDAHNAEISKVMIKLIDYAKEENYTRTVYVDNFIILMSYFYQKKIVKALGRNLHGLNIC